MSTKGSKIKEKPIDEEIVDMDDETSSKERYEKKRENASKIEAERKKRVEAHLNQLQDAEKHRYDPIMYKDHIAVKASPVNLLQNIVDYQEKGFIFLTSVAYGTMILLIFKKRNIVS